MRCISLWQPHASLIFLPEDRRKHYETRSWSTKYHGNLLIHAAKTQSDYCDLLHDDVYRAGIVAVNRELGSMPFGAILGMVTLSHCLPATGECPDGIAYGNFAIGRFAWRLDNPRLLPTPIPYRGSQRFFNVSDAELPLTFTDDDPFADW